LAAEHEPPLAQTCSCTGWDMLI